MQITTAKGNKVFFADSGTVYQGRTMIGRFEGNPADGYRIFLTGQSTHLATVPRLPHVIRFFSLRVDADN